jgi:quercetin dioxygenase-like cupin family protein/pimeloyl-ACP methyl ester carboxylesterase
MSYIARSILRNIRAVRVAAMMTGVLAISMPALAQKLESVAVPSTPLVLKARGSFYVGGETVEQTPAELGNAGPADVATVNQMYVEYMIPDGTPKLPVVMVHGAGLSGKSYDTTPDGRMGWFEYFVRKSHPTYVVDQVGRARSGFNQGLLNRLLAGEKVGDQPRSAFRFGNRSGVWTNFRFGPKYGESFPESQFPTDAGEELAKQGIPDMRAFVPAPNPTFKALADLSVGLKGAVLMSHSQSGHFPMEAALLNPEGIRAIVALEPGTCGNDFFSDEKVQRLAKIPMLIIFGDYLPVPTGFGPMTWQSRLDGCTAFEKRIKAAGGRLQLVTTPSLGMRGNSHMLMQDRNNAQIADYIIKWIDANAIGGTAAGKPQTNAGNAAGTEKMQIWRKGSPPATEGSASNFTGAVQVTAPYRGSDGSRLRGATVKFARGARTAWHRHPGGQALIVTEGCGWTQREGGSIEKICAGDVAWIAPGEKHWHGATRTSAMTHVTASESVEGEEVEWFEKVSDEEYARGPR